MHTTAAERWELVERDRPTSGCRFRDRCPIYRAKGEPAICREAGTEPPLAEVSAGQFVACHFPQGFSDSA
jgi:hypothetical protein